ncbi:MAG: type II secretion system protein GspG, partial [Candidatus Omnitrophica bacterium]|nr:type II secretion system protein GspG [Candidatus Omnitrophota bacterium]
KYFTLIELIVVIAIIAILAAIIAPNAFKAIEKAKVARAFADWKAIKAACGAFYADSGKWPGTATTGARRIEDAGLITNSTNVVGWDGPYLEKAIAHPWGGMYWISRNVNYKTPTGWSLRGEDSDLPDLDMEMGNDCYFSLGSTASEFNCQVPAASALFIDEKLDDGNISTGIVRYFCSDRTNGASCGGDFRQLLYPDTN